MAGQSSVLLTPYSLLLQHRDYHYHYLLYILREIE